ncbi:hypothetical protein Pmani_013186 [Petrolisthes manimaculis]|uniref:Uncharacterized protein n=1 Tax=Petrolisthes manimaculis TaxID=1843537 RepID=A0AAE1PZE1_9EUCA|nr:hypothetical protein Pmani_013186 [Petrolisthes manimaculis]
MLERSKHLTEHLTFTLTPGNTVALPPICQTPILSSASPVRTPVVHLPPLHLHCHHSTSSATTLPRATTPPPLPPLFLVPPLHLLLFQHCVDIQTTGRCHHHHYL